MITNKQLTELRKKLTKGDQGSIAKELNLSVSYVNKVLNGTRQNEKILDKAIQIAKTRKQSESKREKQINNLIQ
jgi:hypothetical protein